ncbi:MAG: type II toxin-antitoxin system MqsA family antitoxin [Firmicutes bacterium]|nr:type II toxin-antitoxin system MqsA family antitoxin [Bacillota bacterium]
MSKALANTKTGLQQAVDCKAQKLVKAGTKKITVAPLPQYSPTEIKAIRNSLELTQLVFSNILGVSIKTVEAWESGKNTPQGPALRMMDMLKKNPELVQRYIAII